MLINKLDKAQSDLYSKYLKAVASLSGLFSENTVPFLHYRTTESIFCKSFKAKNLARSDISYDAQLGSVGIGLKTFIAPKGTS